MDVIEVMEAAEYNGRMMERVEIVDSIIEMMKSFSKLRDEQPEFTLERINANTAIETLMVLADKINKRGIQ